MPRDLKKNSTALLCPPLLLLVVAILLGLCWAPPTACLPPSTSEKQFPILSFFLFLLLLFFFFSLKLIERNLFTRLDVTDVTDKTCFDKVSPTQIVNCGLLCNLDIYIYTDSLSIGKTNCLSLTLIGNFGGNLTKEFRSKSEIDLARL